MCVVRGADSMLLSNSVSRAGTVPVHRRDRPALLADEELAGAPTPAGLKQMSAARLRQEHCHDD